MFKIIKKTKNTLRFVYKDVEYDSDYKEGDDAIYIRLNESTGLKVIYPSERTEYSSQSDTYSTLKIFQEKNYDFFPEIRDVQLHEKLILLEVEHIINHKQPQFNESWLTESDKKYLEQHFTSTDLKTLTSINYKILQEGLCPEDEWYKQGKNIIGGKIVDFHRFTYNDARYNIPTDTDSSRLSTIYQDALIRYSNMGINKWKGKIYEGYKFNNGEEFLGYSSDNIEYDSYRKLNFLSMNKCRNGKVLDIGCNEGFLAIQAALHGASSVYGFDITDQDIALANDINTQITKLNNVQFGVHDAVKFVSDINEKYDVVILSSVLHQIYPNMEGCDEFLSKISEHTDYLAYETPVNHPLMKLPLSSIQQKLKSHFDNARLTYAYNAYSSGYRAIFICWNQEQ